jgi:2-oxoglutarate dehydrogenase E2 component (dihydrolipoamide succinyltransferase)
MILEIKIPSPGESISEVEIGKWLVNDGAIVKKDQEVAEIESDKATFSLSASAKGKIKILLKEGERISVGSVACTIDTESSINEDQQQSEQILAEKKEIMEEEKESEADLKKEVKTPKSEAGNSEEKKTEKELSERPKIDERKSASEKPEDITVQKKEIQENYTKPDQSETNTYPKLKFTAAAKAIMDEKGFSVEDVLNGLHRLTREDIEAVILSKEEKADSVPTRTENRSLMSPLRRKLSERLVAVKNETAMLTTFNEIDLSGLIQLRTKYQKKFSEKYGTKLGYMSFFTKAASIALSQFPVVNSMIEGEEIITPGHQDIGIAVQTEKGLMVPIIRDVGFKSISDLEREIFELAEKARNKRLSVQEMTGGTFTITNGGLFGSLLSTPILNPPQSAILGMHAIKDRPVAVADKVEIRPMMYVALTYDHRLIDGKDSVSFLFKIKQLIENPSSIFLNGKDPEELLLGL